MHEVLEFSVNARHAEAAAAADSKVEEAEETGDRLTLGWTFKLLSRILRILLFRKKF